MYIFYCSPCGKYTLRVYFFLLTLQLVHPLYIFYCSPCNKCTLRVYFFTAYPATSATSVYICSKNNRCVYFYCSPCSKCTLCVYFVIAHPAVSTHTLYYVLMKYLFSNKMSQIQPYICVLCPGIICVRWKLFY